MSRDKRAIHLLLVVSSSCLALSLGGCSASISRSGYDSNTLQTANKDCSRIIIKNKANLNAFDSVVIGKVSASDTGLSTECTESYILDVFRKDACALGADVVNITEESQPNIWRSSCYEAKADLIKLKDASQLASLIADQQYDEAAVSNRSKKTECIHRAAIGVGVGGGLGGLIGGVIAASAASDDCSGEDKTAVPPAPTNAAATDATTEAVAANASTEPSPEMTAAPPAQH